MDPLIHTLSLFGTAFLGLGISFSTLLLFDCSDPKDTWTSHL